MRRKKPCPPHHFVVGRRGGGHCKKCGARAQFEFPHSLAVSTRFNSWVRPEVKLKEKCLQLKEEEKED